MRNPDNKEIINYLEGKIIGLDLLINSKAIGGTYRWYIDGVPFYFGKAEKDILSRCYDHMKDIVEDSDFWIDIVNHLEDLDKDGNYKHTLEIKFYEIYNDNNNKMVYEIELKNIARELPMSQKCNGTDHIIQLNDRDFNLDNLKERYNERKKNREKNG